MDADHACWKDPSLTRKINKRRFGSVVRSQAVGVNKMMQLHAEETHEWILERARSSEDGGDTTEEEDNGGTNS